MTDRDKRLWGSLMGFIVGDALGVPVEFRGRKSLKKNPVTGMRGYGSHDQPAGTWSDDTSMVLATADSIAARGNIDYADMMERFCMWFEDAEYTADGTVFDIGITTRDAIARYRRGIKPEKCGSSGFYDNGNGSLMRMLPIAIFFAAKDLTEREETEIIYYASSLTHAHEISMLGCRIYCDIMRDLFRGETLETALKSLDREKYDRYYDSVDLYKRVFSGELATTEEDRIKSSGYVVDTLEAAIWSVLSTADFHEAVLKAVNLGEDTDTVGAIAGSIAGAVYGYDAIPAEWISKIMNRKKAESIFNSFLETIN